MLLVSFEHADMLRFTIITSVSNDTMRAPSLRNDSSFCIIHTITTGKPFSAVPLFIFNFFVWDALDVYAENFHPLYFFLAF